MDYEKKYKEALELARVAAFNGHQSLMEGIFPELAEPEDEKTMKRIIALVNAHGQGMYKDDMLAWLENIPYTIDHEKREGFHLGYKAALEKQGENKKERNSFDVLPGLYKCTHRMFDGTLDGKLLFEVGNIYKCLSKHDKAEFEASYGHSVYLEDPVVRKHFIPFEKQGEQKLAWSEEDEKAINDIMWIIEAYRENGFNETHIQMADSSENWLKSLKQRITP